MQIILGHDFSAYQQKFTLYFGASTKILHVSAYYGHGSLWVQEDQSERKEAVHFQLIETGRRIENPEKLQYVGTWISDAFVYHLYKELP